MHYISWQNQTLFNLNSHHRAVLMHCYAVNVMSRGTSDTCRFSPNRRVAQCGEYKLLVLADAFVVCIKLFGKSKAKRGVWCDSCLCYVGYRRIFVDIRYLISISASVPDRATNIWTWVLKRHATINSPKKFEPDVVNIFCVTRVLKLKILQIWLISTQDVC